MKKIFLTNDRPVKFKFTQTPYTFKVIESIKVKLIKRGDYKLIEVTKKEKSTIELIEYLSEVFKINKNEIGYAGLKDKHATTTQFLTLPKYVKIDKFKNNNSVEVKELGFCAKPLKIGDLSFNSFKITLENVEKEELINIEYALEKINEFGFANFFGHQRFGVEDESSVEKGKRISDSGQKAKNQRGKILLAAYQSKYFNLWLNRRLLLSRNIINEKEDTFTKEFSPSLLKSIKRSPTLFKLLPGDLGYNYKSGRKIFSNVVDIKEYSEEFNKKRFYPTGVLFGDNVRLSSSLAKKLELDFIDSEFSALRGARRAAWVWPKNLNWSYKEDKKVLKLSFSLLPGSYATVLLEELANTKL